MNQLYEDQEVHDFVSDTHVSVGTHVLPLMASFALYYGKTSLLAANKIPSTSIRKQS